MEVKNETKYGEVCRPGGFSLTERALALCGFPEGARLIDMGCGSGATVHYLNQNGFFASGVEADAANVDAANTHADPSPGTVNTVFYGDAAELPFGDNEADGLFFECSFSKMRAPEAVLSEAKRVLKAGGRLVFTDFYAKGQAREFCGLLGRVEPLNRWRERLAAFGFLELTFEDHSELLPEMWGQLIFTHGLSAVCAGLGTSPSGLRDVKCGYFLLIAGKEEMSCIHP